MKNTKKNIYKISLLAVFLMLIVSGFAFRSIINSGKYNESVVFSKTSESGSVKMESDYSPVLGPLYVNVPPNGFINTTFTVSVYADSSALLVNSTVTISEPSGHMHGTFVLFNVNGTANFNNIYFDAAGTYTITASANGNTASGSIVISPTPVPTKLVITNISVCDSSGNKMVNSLFNVTVQARDNNNFPANVASDMVVSLSLNPGSGLSGNTSGTILTSSNAITIYGVKITAIQSGVIVQASGGTLTPGLSNAFNMVSGPNHMAFVNLPSTGIAFFPLQTFKVVYLNSDNTPAPCFGGTITLTQNSPLSPIAISGNTSVSSYNGEATFYNVLFTVPGITYTIKASSPGFPDLVSGNIVISSGTPQITSTILPLNMQGNSSNLGHTPFVFLAKFSFLTPGAVYKYYNRVVDAVNPGTGEGVGNIIFANPSSSFTRTTNPNFITAGDYGQFTADANGSYTGWFISEATNDAVFTTPGNTVKMRISLSDGNSPFMLTTTETVKIRDYAPTSVPNRCAFIYQSTPGFGTAVLPKNFLLFYTPVDSSHLEYSRPVSGTFVESDGLSLTGLPYYTTYLSSVDGNNQDWGSIIPSDLTNGITRIEERNSLGNLSANPLTLLVGSIRNVAYSSNGVWTPGVDTKNATGSNPLAIQPIFIPVGVTQIGNQMPVEFKLAQNYPNPFNPTTKIKFEIPKLSFVRLNIYDALGREISSLVNEKLSPGTYSIELNASNMPSGVYFYKITAGDYTATKRMVLLK